MKTGERIKNYFKNFKFTADFALKCIAYLVLIAYIVLMAGGKKFFAPTSMFWRSLNVFSRAGDFNPGIRIASYIVFLLGASWIVRFILKQLAKPLLKQSWKYKLTRLPLWAGKTLLGANQAHVTRLLLGRENTPETALNQTGVLPHPWLH